MKKISTLGTTYLLVFLLAAAFLQGTYFLSFAMGACGMWGDPDSLFCSNRDFKTFVHIISICVTFLLILLVMINYYIKRISLGWAIAILITAILASSFDIYEKTILIRNTSLKNHAIETSSLQECDLITDPSLNFECNIMVALSKKDVNVCRQINTFLNPHLISLCQSNYSLREQGIKRQ